MTSFENFHRYPLEFERWGRHPRLVDRDSLAVEFLLTIAPVGRRSITIGHGYAEDCEAAQDAIVGSHVNWPTD